MEGILINGKLGITSCWDYKLLVSVGQEILAIVEALSHRAEHLA